MPISRDEYERQAALIPLILGKKVLSWHFNQEDNVYFDKNNPDHATRLIVEGVGHLDDESGFRLVVRIWDGGYHSRYAEPVRERWRMWYMHDYAFEVVE